MAKRRDGRINVRVDLSQREVIERVAAEMRCTVSVAARFLLAEGIAVHGVDQGDVVFVAARDVIKHLAKMEVRARQDGGTYALGLAVEAFLRRFGPRPPRA